mmetsp:Transcript_23903/g.52719  ORF Transcript_23903/g.52719 Transcript_23903/m.52719 type:complete len:239 (+) Transcript_23903:726-1442(+)
MLQSPTTSTCHLPLIPAWAKVRWRFATSTRLPLSASVPCHRTTAPGSVSPRLGLASSTVTCDVCCRYQSTSRNTPPPPPRHSVADACQRQQSTTSIGKQQKRWTQRPRPNAPRHPLNAFYQCTRPNCTTEKPHGQRGRWRLFQEPTRQQAGIDRTMRSTRKNGNVTKISELNQDGNKISRHHAACASTIAHTIVLLEAGHFHRLSNFALANNRIVCEGELVLFRTIDHCFVAISSDSC